MLKSDAFNEIKTSTKVRLHYYSLGKDGEIICSFLNLIGVNTLLAPLYKSHKKCYGIEEQTASVNGMKILRNDVRLERFCFFHFLRNKKEIVLFCHQDSFVNYNKIKKFNLILSCLCKDISYDL